MLPESLPQALDMLASDGAAIPVAGGTDLLVHWPVHVAAHERSYVDLSRLDALKPLSWTQDELTLGALTTYWDVIQDPRAREEFPLLVDAARQVGAIQIQARGTWAGNIVNASPAADGVPVLMAYDAVVVLESRRGREEVPLDRFYSGYKEMKRRPDQLVVGIRIPRRRYSYQVLRRSGRGAPRRSRRSVWPSRAPAPVGGWWPRASRPPSAAAPRSSDCSRPAPPSHPRKPSCPPSLRMSLPSTTSGRAPSTAHA